MQHEDVEPFIQKLTMCLKWQKQSIKPTIGPMHWAMCPWDQQKIAQTELIHWTQEFRASGA